MSVTGYLWDDAYLGHETTAIHPEKPARAAALATHRIARGLEGVVPRRPDLHLGMPWVRRTHEASYVARVASAYADNARALDAGDTVVREDTYDVALAAAAGACTLAREIATGSLDNGFCAIRPPGHHAGPQNARGYCVFNNAAVATRFVQAVHGLQRVLIIDWDVHPGDGTAAFFHQDPDVHVLSMHQEGLFPPSVGAVEQTGRGAGEGTIHNVPMPAKSGPLEHQRAFAPALRAAAEAAEPDFVIISCGFDAHAADRVSDQTLREVDFVWLTERVREVADHYAGGRLLSLLEGGYCVEVLPRCVQAHVAALMV